MEEDEQAPGVNFIPCIKWVRRGIAKSNPEKVQLTEEELESIITQTKDKLKAEDEDDSGNEDGGTGETQTPKMSKPEDEDKYNFNNYDDEDESPDALLGIGNLAVYAGTNKDPYVTVRDEDDLDSERGDDVITTGDNLILVGHVEGDASVLEVYLYNEEEGSLYVHHDILLPAFPLCLEWLNYEPGESSPGNLCAVGSMEPVIEVWDLDLIDCLEPAFKLGKKARRKKGIPGVGHTDAVLDLSWNTHLPHIMASGSADHTVLLWDLDTGQPASKLDMFREKVQALEFHPFEAETLLAGSCDKVARVFDCRSDGSFKAWELPGEVERVAWNAFAPFYFLASTSDGAVYCVDCRADGTAWQLAAHEGEVTGLALSATCPGLLVTSSSDSVLKIWDVADIAEPTFVSQRPLHVGAVQCLGLCPDAPFVVSGGGDKKSGNFGVWDVMSNSAAVTNRFGSRQLVYPAVVKEESVVVKEEMDVAESCFGTLSLDQQPSTSSGVRRPSQGMRKREKKRKK